MKGENLRFGNEIAISNLAYLSSTLYLEESLTRREISYFDSGYSKFRNHLLFLTRWTVMFVIVVCVWL